MTEEIPFDPARLVALAPKVITHRYDVRDTILYALGVGAGATAKPDLRYLYEQDLQALPTMAVVLAYPGYWQREPEYGIDWKRNLHGEQSVIFHKPLPVRGEVVGNFTIKSVYDKGPDKGSVLYAERRLLDAATGELLATVTQGSFLRGNGGAGTVATEPLPVPHPVPVNRAPEFVMNMATRPEQSILYRLCGDMNPLHIDPVVAANAGFPGPILHGLCTYGLAGLAAITVLCEGDPARLRRLDVRFSSPVFPGETVCVELWREQPGKSAFRAKVIERDVLVLNNGYVEYDG